VYFLSNIGVPLLQTQPACHPHVAISDVENYSAPMGNCTPCLMKHTHTHTHKYIHTSIFVISIIVLKPPYVFRLRSKLTQKKDVLIIDTIKNSKMYCTLENYE
jgi:hypothetical protein